jgi:hypothetical protein
MNLFQANVDPDADTSPPLEGQPGPLEMWSSRRIHQRRQFVLVAVAVPMVALVVGIAAGALAAVLF